jgi:hypothetical protein
VGSGRRLPDAELQAPFFQLELGDLLLVQELKDLLEFLEVQEALLGDDGDGGTGQVKTTRKKSFFRKPAEMSTTAGGGGCKWFQHKGYPADRPPPPREEEAADRLPGQYWQRAWS